MQQASSEVSQTHSPGLQTGADNPSAPDGAATEAAGPYAEEIKDAAEKAYSQFARDVLSDGVITRQEYVEAVNRYKSCMEDHGITVQLADRNGYYQILTISQDPGDADIDVDLSCQQGTLFYIGSLYEKTVTDPENQGPMPQRYACLKRLGLIPDNYTLQQFLDTLDRTAVTITYVNGSAINTPGEVVPDFPFDMNDPRYGACANNPQNPLIPSGTTG